MIDHELMSWTMVDGYWKTKIVILMVLLYEKTFSDFIHSITFVKNSLVLDNDQNLNSYRKVYIPSILICFVLYAISFNIKHYCMQFYRQTRILL